MPLGTCTIGKVPGLAAAKQAAGAGSWTWGMRSNSFSRCLCRRGILFVEKHGHSARIVRYG